MPTSLATAAVQVLGVSVASDAVALPPAHTSAGCVAAPDVGVPSQVVCCPVGVGLVAGFHTSTTGPPGASASVAAISRCPVDVTATDGSTWLPPTLGVATLGVTGPAAAASPGAAKRHAKLQRMVDARRGMGFEARDDRTARHGRVGHPFLHPMLDPSPECGACCSA